MNLALSASLAFAAGVAIVFGGNALSQSAPQAVAAVSSPTKGEAWKACLLGKAGSSIALVRALNAMLEPAYVEGRVDVFTPCMGEENRLLDTVSGSPLARHAKLRGALMLEVMRLASAELLTK